MKNFISLSEIRSEILAGRLTLVKLVEYYLQNIEEKNGRLNAFLSVFREESLERAALIDLKIKENRAGRLAGCIIGIKDVFSLKGHPLTCSSKFLEGFEAQYTATCIQRLLDEDAIIIGRQNCDEFAMGSTNENSAYGITRNPWDESRVPGGSSGGSAAAVAADLCQLSIGSDTGGSVRQPAAFCGVIGVKPTYGRISRYGLASYASSFDTVGILGKSVEDVGLALEVMAGADEMDSTSSSHPLPDFSTIPKAPSKIGVLGQEDDESIQPEIKRALLRLFEALSAEGHQLDVVKSKWQDQLLPVYYVLTAAEASSNLSRYDGVRFGQRASEGSDVNALYSKTRGQFFGEEVKRRILTGTFVLSARYHDAYYTQAQKVRRLIKQETDQFLEKYDILISPTTPGTALKVDEVSNDPIRMYLEDVFTVRANICGIPAISVPIGLDNNGLPIGVQLMSKAFDEAELLEMSDQIITLTNQKGQKR
ncbi:MAG: Asp-tRNA(Asn)/Glu-tRNA(Gln) amidotransferase subunit GatA [Ekhidna sp.]